MFCHLSPLAARQRTDQDRHSPGTSPALTVPDLISVRRLALGGDPEGARSLWRSLVAASPGPDPALVLLGAELSWAFGRGGEALSQLALLATAEERELELGDLFPQGLSLAQRLGGADWLQKVHHQLRQHQQIRAAEQLRQGAGLDRALAGQPVVRTLHHVACSGGTLISRCLAALPEVVLLSELNPLNRHGAAFNPSHPLALLGLSGEPLSQEVLQAEFLNQMGQVLSLCAARGSDLVIRDHSHTDFCRGSAAAPLQPVRAWLAPAYPLLSLVTLRHPLDSWLGLLAAKWQTQMEPATLLAYCGRYQAFLDAYEDLDWIHYENFCSQPEPVFRQICEALCLPCDPSALERFSSVTLSGNSGRAADRIEPRPRRPLPPEVRAELNEPATARALRRLCRRMGYGEG